MNVFPDVKFKDFENICRVCLVNGELKTILKTEIANIFVRISQVELSDDNRLPKKLCVSCWDYLENVSKFAEICKTNDSLLKSILETEDKQTLKNDINSEIEINEEDNDNKHDGFSNLIIDNDDNSSDYSTCTKRLRTRRKRSINDESIEEPVDRKKRCKRRINSIALKRNHQKFKIETNNVEEKSNCIPTCTTCGTIFSSKTKLCSHYKENENCRPENFKLFRCEICKKDFSTVRRRNEHMNIHTGETPYVCSYCGKRFQLYPAHFKHVYRHKLALGEVELKSGYTEKRVRLNLKCEQCPKIFASRSGYANHQLIHQGIKIQYKKRKRKTEGPKLKNFLCNYCAKSFMTKIQLDGHIRGHTGERPFDCKFCNKSFKTKAALKTHEMNHLGTTPQRFKCEICNKPFSLKAHYEVHKRTHTGEKPFECNFCRKCFNYRGTWKIHLRIHTGETPYACPICDNKYHDKSSLNKHQKTKGHLIETSMVKEESKI